MEEAVKVSGELLEDFPEDADARYWRGRALLRLGRHADADRQFQEGLKHGDHQSPVCFILGTVSGKVLYVPGWKHVSAPFATFPQLNKAHFRGPQVQFRIYSKSECLFFSKSISDFKL